jgi:hypothetical protein
MIRALSSSENRRRRPVPVITCRRTLSAFRLKRMVKRRHKPISDSEIDHLRPSPVWVRDIVYSDVRLRSGAFPGCAEKIRSSDVRTPTCRL